MYPVIVHFFYHHQSKAGVSTAGIKWMKLYLCFQIRSRLCRCSWNCRTYRWGQAWGTRAVSCWGLFPAARRWRLGGAGTAAAPDLSLATQSCCWTWAEGCYRFAHFHHTEGLAGGFRMTPNQLHTDRNMSLYSFPLSIVFHLSYFFASLLWNWRFELNFFVWWNIMRLFLGSLYLMCAYFPGIGYIISTLKIPLLVWPNVSLQMHYSTLLLQGEPPTASPFLSNSLSAYCMPINRNMTRNSALNT